MSTLSSHFLTPKKFFFGLYESSLLVRLKWRSMRSWKSKAIALVSLIVFLSVIIGLSNTGYFVRALAGGLTGVSSLAQEVATSYLVIFSTGGLGILGAAALGGVIFSSIVAPFTGAIPTSLVPYSNLTSVRSSNQHRFTDSIFVQLVSTVSILQFLALTTIASLLTIEGGRTWGLLFTWALFPTFAALSNLSLWTAELLYRKYGPKIRFSIILGSLAIVGLGIIIDSNHGRTVFGLGDLYSSAVQNFYLYSSWIKFAAFIGLILLTAFLVFLAGTVSSLTLSLPERITQSNSRRARKVRKPFEIPELETFALLYLQLWRNSETRRPIMAAVAIGAILAFVTQGIFAVQSTFVVMTPIVVALAWGVNIFGVLGSGSTWLASQPKIFLSIPLIAAAVQFCVTLLLVLCIWVPSFIFGRVDLPTMALILLANIATAVLITRSSIAKSIAHPYSTTVGVRGEGVVPPTVTIAYTFRMALWGGQFGVIMLASGNLLFASLMCVAAIIWSAWRFSQLQRLWYNDIVRTNVTTIVSR